MYINLHVECPFFLLYFNRAWIFSAEFKKSSSIRFYEIPSSGNLVVQCIRTDRHTECPGGNVPEF